MFYFEVSVLVSILNSKKRHTKVLMLLKFWTLEPKIFVQNWHEAKKSSLFSFYNVGHVYTYDLIWLSAHL